MNERIRLLAEQAFFDENTNQPSDKMYTFTEHKMKQFAELIVQECIWAFGETRTEPSLERYILDRLGINHE